jgi:pimeloyl-ACP methyl ester carboxylesterase
VLSRLQQEIILPARALGSVVWLGGISLGAYIALCYAERWPDELDGLCLFAPYLGSHLVTGEIERAAGLGNWQPGELAEEDEERRVWRFIKSLRSGPLPVYLGLGSEDRFRDRHRLMAAAIAPSDVDAVRGEHDWATWCRLWERFLDARFAHHPKRT